MSQDQRNSDVEADVAVVEPVEAVDTAPPQQVDLQDQLQQAQAKAEENWKHYLSARAEADNIRKRSEREIQNAHKFALKDFHRRPAAGEGQPGKRNCGGHRSGRHR